MEVKFTPTADQRAALATFKARHGRRWREELQRRFYSGWQSGESLEIYSGLLQQVRNSAGGIEWVFGPPRDH